VSAQDGVVGEFLALAVRLDRLAPGLADLGNVDPALRSRVLAEAAPAPSDLVRQAGRLSRETAGSELDPARREFLLGQLRAVECTARRLTGQPVPFVREIRECFDVTVAMGVEDGYRAAHAELDRLLPGPQPLPARLARYRADQQVPRAQLAGGLAALVELLRDRSRAAVGLPAAESVSLRIVDDAPWSALHQYRGGYRSQVTVNAGARPRRPQLAQLIAHEAYPGHHTERCHKQDTLVGTGRLEHAALITNSPPSVVAEGVAELGLAAVLGPGWGRIAADVLAAQGLGFDGELAARVDAATSRLVRVRLDAALLLHDRHAPVEQVLGHLRRWMLIDDRRAGQVLRFLRHPVWRAYTVTYVEGPELVRRWWAGCPGPDRLRRLLDEPMSPAALRTESAT
jgi:hypothetical protein